MAGAKAEQWTVDRHAGLHGRSTQIRIMEQVYYTHLARHSDMQGMQKRVLLHVKSIFVQPQCGVGLKNPVIMYLRGTRVQCRTLTYVVFHVP